MRPTALLVLVMVTLLLPGGFTRAAPRDAIGPLDKRSGFFDFATFQETLRSGTGGPGFGTIAGIVCTNTTATQPAVFSGNFLLNCDGVGPHNEAAIAINPTNPNNIIAGSHSFLLEQVGGTIVAHIIAAAYRTLNGGATWTNVHPPLSPYQFTGDPVLFFDATGRAYFVNLGDHEGQGFAFTNVSIIVQSSDDGGLNWTDPVTIAKGQGAVAARVQTVVFNDKPWGVADTSAASSFMNNVYVTWTRFLFRNNQYVESPIFFSRSTDGGVTWSTPIEISGSSNTLCSAQIDSTGGNRCDEDQLSVPVVAPNGDIFVVFINDQKIGDGQFRDQFLVVKSTNGGVTWSAPVAATPLINDGVSDYPLNSDGRQTLTGCAFRVNPAGALAVSSATANSGQLYYVFTENTNPGLTTTTQTDIMVVTSTDGGANWSSPVTVNSSNKDQVYPWAAVGADGKLRVGYVDRNRTGPTGQSCVYGYTLSTATNLAATAFTHETMETALSIASDSRFFRVSSANHNTRFIGDYTNIATTGTAVTGTTVWGVWTDMRQTITLFGSTGKDQDAVAAKKAP